MMLAAPSKILGLRGVFVLKAIYPGSFDPVTLGHWDLIQRAEKLVDRLVVAVLHNPGKNPAFSVAERVDFLRELVAPFPNVEVATFHGLLVDFARQENAQCIVRGVRAFSDFEYEFQMALMNRKLHPDLETLFLMPKEEFSVLSSRMVREVGTMGGDITGMVPELFRERIAHRLMNPAELG
ncbi:MAG: Phosphopantetheine adenylyltransferase [Acidobacteria bacterium ADurb.Bin340]|nr:MAG: Phosphopantetheine adenylyltransferase [Acidobacteria bacterium ADurb.Bin340]